MLKWILGLGLTLIAAISLAIGLGPSDRFSQELTGFSDTEQATIAALVEQTLLEKPEIIPQAMQFLQFKRQREEQQRLETEAMANRQAIEQDPIAPAAGNPDGTVTVVEFYDYQCQYCRRSYTDVKQILATEDNIRYIFKQFPVLDREGEPPVSRTAARYALAATQQGKFLEFHDTVMSSNGRLTLERLDQLVVEAGLDLTQLKADASEPLLEAYLDTNLQLGARTGINGTPTYVINGLPIAGARGLQTLKDTIRKAEAAM